MASKPKSGPQDMPPPGGFRPIQTARVNVRRILSPTLTSALTVASLSVGLVGYGLALRDARRSEIEMNGSRNILWCLQLAERDRAFLKQMRANREEERELMKDYPGWVVGTYFGEPMYETQDPKELIEPTFHEYMAHSSVKDMGGRIWRFIAT